MNILFIYLFFYLQVDPDVFAALPKELQEELRSAYNRGSNAQLPAKICTSPGDQDDKFPESRGNLSVGVYLLVSFYTLCCMAW